VAERRPHPPSQARELVAAAKAGSRSLPDLLAEARTIEDPSFAAEALVALSGHPKVSAEQARRCLDEALKGIRRTERDWRRAEALAEVARRLPKWRTADDWADRLRHDMVVGLVDVAVALPPGPAASQAIAALAPLADGPARARLLRKALQGPAALEDGKAVMAAGAAPEVVAALEEWPPAARARLLGSLHLRGGASLERALLAAGKVPPAERVEVLRGLIAPLEDFADLDMVHTQLMVEPEPAARVLCSLAARADKLGDPARAQAWLDEAAAQAERIADPKAQAAVRRNIDTGRARLAGEEKPAAKPTEPEPEPVAKPAQASARHMLVLHDTYVGALGDPHLRAIARAAPLCEAFGLDLGLLNFPVQPGDLEKAVRDTRIGDAGRHLQSLLAEGRVHVLKWPVTDGFVVATTPNPEPKKAVDFAGAAQAARFAGAPRLVVVMGLGPKGLPGTILRDAPAHLELTGRGVSMETATAMGILADRLRQVPPI
jgi:hypothetical protein